MPIHRRTLEFEAFDEGSELEVIGHLRDDRPWAEPGTSGVHDMELRVRVRLADMTITECQAAMHTFPHAECPAIVDAFAGLAGLSVTRGFTRAVQAQVAGPRGCTHLDQLARSLGAVVVQAVTSRRARSLREGSSVDMLSSGGDAPWARDSCHVWAEGGVAEQKLAAGWRPGRGPYPAPSLAAILARDAGWRRRRRRPARTIRLAMRRRPVPRAGRVALVLLGLGLVAGCSTSGTAIHSPFDTSPPRLEHGPVYEVKVGQVAGLGQVLVDGQGITLYLYATDRQGSPSRCYNLCEVAWPPLVLPTGQTRPIAGPGIKASLLGTAPRNDGTIQITYNGWPLYLWPQDRAPGQATGQALTNAGGLWYVLDPAGNAVHTSSVA